MEKAVRFPEVEKFLALILEKVDDLHNKDWIYQYEDVCEEFEMDEIDPDDYGNNEYDYSSQSKAKHACKEQLNNVINDVKAQYREMRDERYEEILGGYEKVNAALEESLDDILLEMQDYMDECEDDAVVGKIKALLEELDICSLNQKYNIVNQVSHLVAKFLPEETVAVKKVSEYLVKCEYDSDEDDMYSYDLESATEEITESVCDTANVAIRNMYSALELIYQDVKDAIGVFILRCVYNSFVGGGEEIEVPQLLDVEILAEKVMQDSNNTSAVANVLNRYTKDLFGIMQGKTVSDMNISHNGKVLLEIIGAIREYCCALSA